MSLPRKVLSGNHSMAPFFWNFDLRALLDTDILFSIVAENQHRMER